MKPTTFSFTNKDGIELSGKMDWPANQQPRAYALFAHCFTCGKSLNAVRNISKSLAGRGFAVFSFDFTGLGKSEGEFADTTFSANVDDLVAASRFLESEFASPALLIGHSLGGAAVIEAARRLMSVRAVATIGAPADTEHVTHIFDSNLQQLKQEGIAQVDIGGRPFTLKQDFVDDLKNHTVTETIGNLRKAVLLLHSPQDATVGIENAAILYTAATHPKSFISLDGADHLLTNKDDSQYVGEIIASWASRYLQQPSSVNLTTQHQTVALIGSEDNGYTTLVKAGKHYITADEPEDVGGNDYGPSPYELLSASLATCTAMTLRMYANRKKLPVDEIKVHVNHSKRHSEDSVNTERIDHFERLVELAGNLTEDQQSRLLEIANKCPVHKTLEGEIMVDTRLLL
ncbi:MAG: alpha/beta fold hydrolase [Cyclobacteriaceae bacterium]